MVGVGDVVAFAIGFAVVVGVVVGVAIGFAVVVGVAVGVAVAVVVVAKSPTVDYSAVGPNTLTSPATGGEISWLGPRGMRRRP